MNSDLWRTLEFRHLAALRAVAQEGSFAAAALKLGYTQSAVSQQIAMLERIVGARVVARRGGRRPAELTDVGRVLADHAEVIVARLRAAQADVTAAVAGQARPLRVGCYESVAIGVLPAPLRDFQEMCPEVPIRVHEHSGDLALVERVEDGRLDFAFTTLSEATRSLASLELLRDPYVLVVDSGSPLAASRKPFPVSKLAGLRLITLRNCSQQPLLDAVLRANAVEPNVVFSSDDNGVVQNFVAAGVGAALVPRLTMDASMQGTRLLELADGPPARRLGLVWNRDRLQSAAASAFIAASQAAFTAFTEQEEFSAQRQARD
ncbi:MAG TPA: LysR substrate-binding domain-containing protein [Gaiellaceae bacterium]|nr:LysR substrate-binding domain-containing protein [Gaiellaceae bacterium]